MCLIPWSGFQSLFSVLTQIAPLGATFGWKILVRKNPAVCVVGMGVSFYAHTRTHVHTHTHTHTAPPYNLQMNMVNPPLSWDGGVHPLNTRIIHPDKNTIRVSETTIDNVEFNTMKMIL